MLKIQSLNKRYGKFTAIEDLSLEIGRGQVCVLLGPNGAGKSTTIKSVAGLLRHRGKITIGGYPLEDKEARKLFGYVPETPTLYDLLTVSEHLEFIASAYGISDYKETMNHLLTRFDLIDKVDKVGKELSKGMQQKLSICCACIIKPQLIMFDEPMMGLDPKAIKELKKMIIEMKEAGCSMIISTHIIDSIEGLWDRVLIMNNGKIVYDITQENLACTGKNIEELFFSVTEVEK